MVDSFVVSRAAEPEPRRRSFSVEPE